MSAEVSISSATKPADERVGFLPRFSDPRDIDEFVTTLEKYERGEISPEAFRAFRLVRGVYGQRQEGFQMMRVKIPFGRLVPEQLDALADVADGYGRGVAHVTTRQCIQYHFMPMAYVETAMRRLDEAGLTTREACGNSVRNITACDHTGVHPDQVFDVTPYAEALVRYFLRHPLAATLPRKFKTAFSCCARDAAKAHIHDLGFVARIRDGQRGFKVVCAGGLSTTPQNALVLHEFVPAAELARVGEAIVRLFDRLGNRDNRHRARLKYVLRKLGEEAFRRAYAEVRAEVDAEAIRELLLPDPPATAPAPPVVSEGPRAPGYLAWAATNVFDQKQPGYAGVYVRLELGDLTSAQLRALGKIARVFGDGTLRLTIDQNVLVPWVDRRSLPALHGVLHELGLDRKDIHTARDVTSCPGADSCNLAVTSSRALAKAIGERLEGEDPGKLTALKSAVIKVSGCPNSCGQHHVADIGFHGAAKTTSGVTVPMYQLHLGGGVDERGARFGKQIVKIVARRAPDAVVLLLRLYESDRVPDETPAAFFARVDPKRVTAALGSILGPPVPGDELDLGQSQGFLLHTGEGECAA
jgi:sulfite reductase beta subunit-like hemoprotein